MYCKFLKSFHLQYMKSTQNILKILFALLNEDLNKSHLTSSKNFISNFHAFEKESPGKIGYSKW